MSSTCENILKILKFDNSPLWIRAKDIPYFILDDVFQEIRLPADNFLLAGAVNVGSSSTMESILLDPTPIGWLTPADNFDPLQHNNDSYAMRIRAHIDHQRNSWIDTASNIELVFMKTAASDIIDWWVIGLVSIGVTDVLVSVTPVDV